jgi:hypothetical protein
VGITALTAQVMQRRRACVYYTVSGDLWLITSQLSANCNTGKATFMALYTCKYRLDPERSTSCVYMVYGLGSALNLEYRSRGKGPPTFSFLVLLRMLQFGS